MCGTRAFANGGQARGGNGARSLCPSGVERGGGGGGGRSLGMQAWKTDGEGARITQSAHTSLSRTRERRQGAHTRGWPPRSPHGSIAWQRCKGAGCRLRAAGGRGGPGTGVGGAHRWGQCGSLGGPGGPDACMPGTSRGKCLVPQTVPACMCSPRAALLRLTAASSPLAAPSIPI